MIWMSGRWWEVAELAAGGVEAGDSEQVAATLAFCQAWQRGDASFEMLTSGSTGAPKPVHLTRSQMTASARATAAALGLAAGMSALVCLPVRYIAGRMMLVRGFVLGLKLVVVEPATDPLAALPGDLLGDLAADLPVDLAAFVPLQMQTLLDQALLAHNDSCFPDDTAHAFRYRRRLEAMRAILVGGGPVAPALAAQIRQLDVPVYHTYGMTETATHIALRRLNGAAASAAFTPLPGVVTGVDGRGCLHLCGPMTGGEVIQTNDLVELHADGAFVWVGRWDNVINSGGVKVPVESVEAVIEGLAAEQPELGLARRRCFVAGLADARLGQMVTLIIEGDALSEDQAAQLRWALSQALPRHHAPRAIRYAPRFVETPTGKIDRGATLSAAASPEP